MRHVGLALLFAGVLWAASPSPFAHGSVELLANAGSIAPSNGFELGLHFQLEPGWHIYWENPGDSGQPPRVTWHLPAGVTAGAIEWPAPRVLGSSSIVDYGYENEVLLPVPVRVTAPLHGALALAADVNVLLCKTECIPSRAHVALTLPVGAAAPAPAATAKLFAGAAAALPRPLPAAWRARATEDAKAFTLTIAAGRRLDPAQVQFFPLSPDQVNFSAPRTATATATGITLVLPKAMSDTRPSAVFAGVLAIAGLPPYQVKAAVVPDLR